MSSTSTDNGGMVVGDTKGAALVFQDIAISRGSNRVLNNVNFRVQRNQRWGIVGPNGAGKSTLLVSGRHI
jgi:ABC-type molybdenum transport system ATPase subunit/photorepair protein PhrA